MDGWTKNYPLLGEAYRLKEAFYGIWGCSDPQAALDAYESWMKSIPPELYSHFQPIVTAWRNWQPEIIAYFEHPVTNAYTESLNNLIRVMNRLGRGYSFEALRAKILFTEGVHAHKQKRPKFERRGEVRIALPEFAEEIKFDRGGTFGYARMVKAIPSPKPPKAMDQQDFEQTDKNYGADISTLVRLIEEGKL